MYENAMEDRTGGVIAQNTYWRGAAHSNSKGSIGTENYARTEEKLKTKPRSRGREAGTGACEISPTRSALEETQNI